jgi:Holliday junction resolvase RusA-like endonuclease
MGKAQWRAIKARKAAKVMAWTSARQARWQFVPGRVRLQITYVFPINRRRDIDNLYARSVGLVNGLKGEFFEDDDTEHLDLHVTGIVERGVKETRLVLEAIP